MRFPQVIVVGSAVMAQVVLSDAASQTWDFEDGTMQGFVRESGDCGPQPKLYTGDPRITPPSGGGSYYVDTYMNSRWKVDSWTASDFPTCAYADKTNTFRIEAETSITWNEASQGHRVCVKRLSDDSEIVCKGIVHREHNLPQRSISSSELSGHVGEIAYMWFADESTGWWGHIQLDNLHVADVGPAVAVTESPTGAPTKSPTGAPTKSPTDAPVTQSPSSAPTRTPWDITFQSIITNFGLNSTNQLVVDYRVGKQTFASELYKGGCKKTSSENTAISNIDVSKTLTSVDDTDGMKNITLSYSFDTANITSSNIWSTDNNTTKIELCQVAQLTAAGPDGDMVITEDMRNITIDFDLEVDFEIEGGVDLAGATIEAEQQNTSLSDFITAFKCSGEFGSAEDSSALAPNTELHVCIKSSSDEVIINKIVSMQIDGKNPANEDSSLPVIANDVATLPAFTTLSYETPKPYEAIVTTRVPINMFNFEATNANIAVSGALTVALDDGTRRRLTISKPYRALQDAGNEAAFDLNIDLQPDADAGSDLEGEGAMMNSARAAASKGFAVLGMMAASAFALW